MRKLRAILFFTALTTLVFGMNAMAAGGGKGTLNTDTVSFLHATGTPTQRAVFAAFLSRVAATTGVAGVDTAISVSNILAVPPATAPPAVTGGVNDLFDVLRNAGNRTGTLEFYLFDRDGTLLFFETGAGTPGRGVSATGTLSPGQTYTVLLEEILEKVTGDRNKAFTGYGWVVGNFDGLAGTYNVTIFGVGFTQAFHLEPAMGSGGLFGGVPISVP